MICIAIRYLFVVLLGITACLTLSDIALGADDDVDTGEKVVQVSPFADEKAKLKHIRNGFGNHIHCVEIADNYCAIEVHGVISDSWSIGYKYEESNDFRQRSFFYIVSQVTGYSHSNGYIYGRTPDKYFIFKTTKLSAEDIDRLYGEDINNSIIFSDEQAFAEFLTGKLGINEYILLDPQAEFDKLSDIEKNPWNYFWFHGWFYLEDLGLVFYAIILSGIGIGIWAGIIKKRKTARWAALPGVLLGILFFFIFLPISDPACGFLVAIFTLWPFFCWLCAILVYNIIRAYWYYQHDGLKGMLSKIYHKYKYFITIKGIRKSDRTG